MKSGGMKIASGHRRSARIAGIAEGTPKRLSSYETAQTTDRLPRHAITTGFPAQPGIVALLHRGIKRVHIHVNDLTNHDVAIMTGLHLRRELEQFSVNRHSEVVGSVLRIRLKPCSRQWTIERAGSLTLFGAAIDEVSNIQRDLKS
jgi:hypothetical protein